jgi:hypothetical protein
MPPEEAETTPAVAEEPPEDLGATDSDALGATDSKTEDYESVGRMMGFARDFAESISAGDEALEMEISNFIGNSPSQAEGEESQLVFIEHFEYDFADMPLPRTPDKSGTTVLY